MDGNFGIRARIVCTLQVFARQFQVTKTEVHPSERIQNKCVVRRELARLLN